MSFDMKRYLILALTLSIAGLIGLGFLYVNEKKERARTERNLEASLSDIQTYKAKTGELVSVISGYELKVKEFEQLLPELYKDIATLKLKVKNAQSVTQIVTVVKYVNKDSLIPIYINDTTKLYQINDKWLKAKFRITKDKYIRPNDFSIDSIPNTAIVVPEITYKGWWFWRKATWINVHIKNSNPYMTVTEGNYIDLRK